MSDLPFSFEQWLQQTISRLDQELEQLAQIDERLRSHLTFSVRSPEPPEEDMVNQLLSEVRRKAQTLYFYRDLNFLSKQSLSHRKRDMVLSREAIQNLLAQHAAQAANNPWKAIQLKLQPPYIIEREGIAIGLDDVNLSAEKIEIAFSLRGSIPLPEINERENNPASTSKQIELFPVLAGIHLEDDTGTIYAVEAPPFFQIPYKKQVQWEINSHMTFSGSISPQVQALYLIIESFLLLPLQVFLILDKVPPVIHGPWKFTFLPY
jgi:hypothetical protein